MIKDIFGRRVRLTDERLNHMRAFHPELANPVRRIRETLIDPERVVQSASDTAVSLFYRFYRTSPVGPKYFAVVVKFIGDDYFVLTSYFTDKIKQGDVLWTKVSA